MICIRQELVLREGSDFFVKWSSPSESPVILKIFLFEIMNPEDMEVNGSRPLLAERGPFTYSVKSWKDSIEFEEGNRHLSYKEHRSYHFMKEKSVGNLENEITILNIPLLVSHFIL